MNPWLNPSAQLTGVLIYLVIVLIVFLIGREIVCWYFKINSRQRESEKQTVILERILAAVGQRQTKEQHKTTVSDVNTSLKE